MHLNPPRSTAVQRDLALVRNPALAFSLSVGEIASLHGSTREIVGIIAELPWVSTNLGVLDASLFIVGISDEMLDYLAWLENAPSEVAA